MPTNEAFGIRDVTAAPLWAGVLFGGRSTRMGLPKHLLRMGDLTWLEHVVGTVRPFVEEVILLGSNEVPQSLRQMPVLPDVPGKPGPIAAILAAMRSRTDAAWLFTACDLPRITPAAVQWLTRQRSAGVVAIMPRRAGNGRVEPLFALYEPEAGILLEECNAPSGLVGNSGVISPEPPLEIARAWESVNTPEEFAVLQTL